MAHPQDDRKHPRWHPYICERVGDRLVCTCRMCGQEFSRSEFVRLHIRDVHHENMPPSPQEYLNGATWTRKEKEETTP